jgi:DNA-binding NarL/FixJ family response regulator
MKRKYKIVLVEDHPIVREGVKRILAQEPDLTVCGEADEQATALEIIRRQHPDLVLMDLTLKSGDGLDLVKFLHAEFPDLPILVLSLHDEAIYSERVLRAGARGYIMKEEAVDRILVAVRQVLAGNIYAGARAVQKILNEVAAGKRDDEARGIGRLSDRELQVFMLMGKGLGTVRIAQEMSLSVKTIETYQAHIKDKLGMTLIEDMRRASVQWGQH